MAKRYADAFRRDAVRMATISGVTRPQLSSDLGGGQSTLRKWDRQHQHVDLMSGLHDDVEKKNTRLRKEVRLLREEREVLKKRSNPVTSGHCIAMLREVSLQAKAGEIFFHRHLKVKMTSCVSLQSYAGHTAYFLRVAGSTDEPVSTR